MDELICQGCGAKIQSEDTHQAGYCPKKVIDEWDFKEVLYCQRCFCLRHYAQSVSNDIPAEDYIKVIQSLEVKDSLIVLIVDIFDFSGSFLPNIKRLTGQNDIILAANKIDLLPSSTNYPKILSWVNQMCLDEGLNVLDSILISSKKNIYIDELLDLIKKYKGNRDCYIVGSSNVGKSKLVNQILYRLTGSEKDVITVSNTPNTTLKIMGFPFGDGTYIYDTPGILNRHQYLRYLTKNSLKIAVPQKEIKPNIYQLEDDQTLFVGGLARFDFLTGARAGRNNVTLYFSNMLNIHRTKLSQADELYKTKLYSLLTPPFSASENLPSFSTQEFSKRDNEKYDIVISGLGFITLRAPFRIKVHAPVMVGVYIRKAII